MIHDFFCCCQHSTRRPIHNKS